MKFEYKMRLLTNINNAEISEISELLKLNKAGCAKSINGNLSINYSKEAFQRIISNQEITISRLNNKLIGYCLIGKNTNQENLYYQKIKAMEISKMLEIPICEIGYGCQIFIDPSFRGNGIARLLFEKLCSNIENNYSMLLCTINKENSYSKKVHKKIGWEFYQKGDISDYYIYKIT